MNDVQQREAARHFADYWKGKGYEKGESQKFWLSLLSDVFGIEHAAEYISFEDQVHLDHTSFIDGYIPATHVLIEQKGIGKDMKKPIRQSDGPLLLGELLSQHGQLGFRARDGLFIVLNASPGQTEGGLSFLDLLIDGAHIAREIAGVQRQRDHQFAQGFSHEISPSYSCEIRGSVV
ncbi:MAG: hypothetical protein J5472_01985 [Clostridia bacterium]|nr:hypothetical protein [Clostridia bacterium]